MARAFSATSGRNRGFGGHGIEIEIAAPTKTGSRSISMSSDQGDLKASVCPASEHPSRSGQRYPGRTGRPLAARTTWRAVARAPNAGGSSDVRTPADPAQMQQREGAVFGQQEHGGTDEVRTAPVHQFADVAEEADLAAGCSVVEACRGPGEYTAGDCNHEQQCATTHRRGD